VDLIILVRSGRAYVLRQGCSSSQYHTTHAWHTASKRGCSTWSLDTLLALVEDDRVEDNAQDDNCCTGLSFASANGYFDVVAALLSHKTIDVNRPERCDFAAVFWAVAVKSMRTISHFFADKRVDLDHLDKQGRTVLSWAAEGGAVDIVKEL
jgi:ankyrin repeat domain-containing protein 50